MFSWSSFIVGFMCGTFFIGFSILSIIIVASLHQFKDNQNKSGEFARKFQEGIMEGAREALKNKKI